MHYLSRNLSLLYLGFASAAWGQPQEPAPISLDAASSTLDRASNTMTFKALHIQQGPLSLAADEASASGLDFARSEWRFSGNVSMRFDSTALRAERAEFVFADHTLASARLSGNPATVEAYDTARNAEIRGGAEELVYDRDAGTLRLSGTAWLTEGQNEMRGCDLIYDVRSQRVTVGSSECGEPVRITILPPPAGEAEPTP